MKLEDFSYKGGVDTEWNFFKDLFLAFLTFIERTVVQPEAKWVRERGMGLGKVRKPGLELGTPEAQRRYMSARCLRCHRRQPECIFEFKNDRRWVVKWKRSINAFFPNGTSFKLSSEFLECEMLQKWNAKKVHTVHVFLCEHALDGHDWP